MEQDELWLVVVNDSIAVGIAVFFVSAVFVFYKDLGWILGTETVAKRWRAVVVPWAVAAGAMYVAATEAVVALVAGTNETGCWVGAGIGVVAAAVLASTWHRLSIVGRVALTVLYATTSVVACAATDLIGVAVTVAAAATLVTVARHHGRSTLRAATVVVAAAVIVLGVRGTSTSKTADEKDADADTTTTTQPDPGPDLETLQGGVDAAQRQVTVAILARGDTAAALDRLETAETALREAQDKPKPLPDAQQEVQTTFGSWASGIWHWAGGTGAAGPVLTVVLAIALLLFYRWLEIVSGARIPGPVTVTTVAGDVGTDAEKYKGRLQRWLDETELRAPPSLPGGSESEQVLKLIQESAPTDTAKKIAAAVQSIAKIVFPTSGYNVTAIYEGPGLASAPATGPVGGTEPEPVAPPVVEHVASVRLANARTDEVIAVFRASSSDADRGGSTAVREVAFQVACTIAARSKTIPRWARWRSPIAWYDYNEALHTTADTVVGLRRAVHSSPSTGLGMAQLSIALDGEKRYSEAFELLVRVAAENPWFLAPRYRLAVSYTFLAANIDELWWRGLPSGRRQLAVSAIATSGMAAELSRRSVDLLGDDLSSEAILDLLRERPDRPPVPIPVAPPVPPAPAAVGSAAPPLPAAGSTAASSAPGAVLPPPPPGPGAGDPPPPPAPDTGPTSPPVDATLVFLGLAKVELEDLDRAYRHRVLVVAGLADGARDTWLDRLRDPRDASRWKQVIGGCRTIVELEITRHRFGNDHDPDGRIKNMKTSVDKIVGKSDVTSQAQYNAACCYSRCLLFIGGDSQERTKQRKELTDTAFEYLNQSVRNPEGSQVSADWLRADPDLEPLRSDPRFEAIASALEPPTLPIDDEHGDRLVAGDLTKVPQSI